MPVDEILYTYLYTVIDLCDNITFDMYFVHST